MNSFIMFLICLSVYITLISLLSWIRKGNGGIIGIYIRRSDYGAWEKAIEEAMQDLDEIKKREPKRLFGYPSWFIDFKNSHEELKDLEKAKPIL